MVYLFCCCSSTFVHIWKEYDLYCTTNQKSQKDNDDQNMSAFRSGAIAELLISINLKDITGGTKI